MCSFMNLHIIASHPLLSILGMCKVNQINKFFMRNFVALPQKKCGDLK